MRSASGSPSLVVHDGEVPDGAVPPYVVVYFDDTDPELPDSRPLDGQPKRFVLHIYAHCVGGHAIAARAVSQRVRGALLGMRPTVTGRQCFPIRREDGQPPRPDETTGRMVMDKIDLYRLESEPA
ncbi:tail completion protein gp17 [Micromonospora tulbaghiae]|uniref:tail completion protein gp17 n=1 Tax=Micromonospora tulbaghiae TaxID=479978 RepID=UPI003F4DA993